MDKNGKCLIIGDEVWVYRNEGIATVKINNKWGIISLSGEYIIKPSFDTIWFDEGIGCVSFDNSCWFINKDGKLAINKRFEGIGLFYDGLAAAKINGKWGFINKMGVFVINPQFDSKGEFHNGFAVVIKNKMPIVINKEGTTIISATDFPGYSRLYNDYDLEMGGFSENHAWITLCSKRALIREVGYINKDGKLMISPRYMYGGDFSEGLASVSISKYTSYGFIDISGRYIIQPQFEYARIFSEGLAAVVKSNRGDYYNKWSYINKQGEEIIKTRFSEAENFSNGKAFVSIRFKNDVIKSGYINKQGYSFYRF